ncbi:MAG: redox-regulated ATPase YchF [Candidatus Aenigmarchaeota archaeon]|nr:redox-regulated ATPase YchF [Candidatus Aenigmarchaeota archaeon]
MLELALVGAPNSGKSTFFKAATLKDVKIAPYPFTTLEPNEGLAYVTAKCVCAELGTKCIHCIDNVRFVPVKLWDVAGLVPEAHLGKGRGNEFLTDVMKASGFIQIVDASGRTDSEGNPSQEFDPSKTVGMLEKELDYWLLSLIKKDWRAIQQDADFSKTIAARLSGLGFSEGVVKRTAEKLGAGKGSEDLLLLDFLSALRKQAKPAVIAANKCDVRGARSNLEKMRSEFSEYPAIPTSAEIELALKEASKEEMIEYTPGNSSIKIISEDKMNQKQKFAVSFMSEFLKEHGSTGVQQCLNTLVFELLDMIVVYPVADVHKFTDKHGNVLPDAYLMKKGSTALDLAFAIHQDFGHKFIAAVDARTGRNVSANYVLQNNDVLSIKSGK